LSDVVGRGAGGLSAAQLEQLNHAVEILEADGGVPGLGFAAVVVIVAKLASQLVHA